MRRGPLSFAQERLWFLDRLHPGSCAYNEPMLLELAGDLRILAFRDGLREIVRRHEILRTRYAADADGRPEQIVMPDSDVPLPVVDVLALPDAARKRMCDRLVADQVRRPFSLETGRPLRTLLIRLARRTHILVVVVHHIAGDEWSAGVFRRELALLYGAFAEGRPSPLQALATQYLDVARTERDVLNEEALRDLARQWAQRLSGMEPLDLPGGQPPAGVSVHEVGWSRHVLDRDVTAAVEALSRRLKTTVSNTLLTTFEILLGRYSGRQRFLIGVAMTNRDGSAVRDLVGLFVNSIVLRADLTGEPTFEALVARTSREVFDGYMHQRLPFEKIVAVLQPARSLEHDPLFGIVWSFHHGEPPAPVLPGLTARLLPPPARSVTASDLECQISLIDGRVHLNVGYRRARFDAATVDRLVANWVTLIDAALEDPSLLIARIPLLSATEQRQVVVENNDTARAGVERWNVLRLLESQVASRPDAVAICAGSDHVTYRAMQQRTGRLAAHLHALGVGPDVRVAVCMHRGLDMVLAVLGVLEANGAFVPMDASYPAERLAFMLEDTAAPVVVSEREVASRLPIGWAQVISLPEDYELMPADAPAPPVLVSPQHLAYVIYTSGSTGKPKGVGVTHGGAANLAMSQSEWFPARGGRALQVASFSFDAAVWELLVSIAVGRTAVLADREASLGGAALAELLQRELVELALLPPSQLATVPHEGLSAFRMLVAGAESCPADLAARWTAGRFMVNAYGPTEATVIGTMAEVHGDGVPPIGRPITNTQAYVLDRAGMPVPIGVAGELYLGGAGLARGYMNRPSLTAERFLPDALSGHTGERLYRTGDRARWRPDGLLEYLGRVDRQVKVRGHRIELEELEAVLGAQRGVGQAVAAVQTTRRGDAQLVAFVVPARDADVDASALASELRRQLPDYMMPAVLRVVADLPMTLNGKIDRRSLPAVDLPPAEGADSAPRTVAEELVAEIWAHVLQVPAVGRHANFFELGGHSLLATQVVTRVRRAFGVDVPLRALFESPSVAVFAAAVARLRDQGSASPTPPLQPLARPSRVPLSFAQERLWILDQWQPGSAAYNVPLSVRLTGRLDVSAVGASLRLIVERHESLRTAFRAVDGVPFQVIAPDARVPFHVVDLSACADPEAVARAQASREAARPFDLARGPLLRVVLFRLASDTSVLLITLHHIVSDGWSVGVLVREFSALYSMAIGEADRALPSLPVQYADYAIWQREWLQGPVLDEQLQHWTRRLADVPALTLPTDRPRHERDVERGATYTAPLPPDVSVRVRAFGRGHGVTPFMALLAAFEVLLSRRARQDQFTLGVPLANRDRAEVESLIGFFVNMWPVHADLRGNPSWRDLLERVRVAFLDASRCQELPFERLGPAVLTRAEAGRPSLFNVAFAAEHDVVQLPALPGVAVDTYEIGTGTIRFDIALWIRQSPERLGMEWRYDCDLFTEDTIAGMADEYARLLQALVDAPDAAVTAIGDSAHRQVPRRTAAPPPLRRRGRRAPPSVQVS